MRQLGHFITGDIYSHNNILVNAGKAIGTFAKKTFAPSPEVALQRREAVKTLIQNIPSPIKNKPPIHNIQTQTIPKTISTPTIQSPQIGRVNKDLTLYGAKIYNPKYSTPTTPFNRLPFFNEEIPRQKVMTAITNRMNTIPLKPGIVGKNDWTRDTVGLYDKKDNSIRISPELLSAGVSTAFPNKVSPLTHTYNAVVIHELTHADAQKTHPGMPFSSYAITWPESTYFKRHATIFKPTVADEIDAVMVGTYYNDPEFLARNYPDVYTAVDKYISNKQTSNINSLKVLPGIVAGPKPLPAVQRMTELGFVPRLEN